MAAVIRAMAYPSKDNAAVYKPDPGKGEIPNTLYQKYRCPGILSPATHPYNY